MQSQLYIPHPLLQPFVVSIITIDAFLPHALTEAVTPYPPAPHQSIIFYGENRIQMQKGEREFELQPASVIIGPQYTRVNVKVTGQLKAVRVDFHPGGLYRLLGIPMKALYDNGFDAREIMGSKLDAVEQQILDAPDGDTRKTIVEQFLLAQCGRLKEALPIDAALQILLRFDGNLSIEKVASLSCLSPRQLERQCAERIGLTPKAFARIARFSKAYRLREAQPGLTWTTIAHEAGYFDQMHLIRDFKEFAGVRPGLIEASLAATPFRMQAHLIV